MFYCADLLKSGCDIESTNFKLPGPTSHLQRSKSWDELSVEFESDEATTFSLL